MLAFDVSSNQFLRSDFTKAATAFSNYVEPLSIDERTAFEQITLDPSPGQYGSPQQPPNPATEQ